MVLSTEPLFHFPTFPLSHFRQGKAKASELAILDQALIGGSRAGYSVIGFACFGYITSTVAGWYHSIMYDVKYDRHMYLTSDQYFELSGILLFLGAVTTVLCIW